MTLTLVLKNSALIKIKTIDNQKYIWCLVRKKYLQFQPEEEVRQKFIEFMSKEKNYPLSLMKVESLVKYPKMIKRPDIVVYNRSGKAVMIVECKAPKIKISQKVFRQVSQYNQQLQAPYLIVTNGKEHYCCRIKFSKGEICFLNDIPDYKSL